MRWLEKSEVLAIHESIIRNSSEAPGLKSDHLLESALAKPLNLAAYENPGIYDLAASYAEGISRNHAFENANKRTALVSSDIFLRKNGIELKQERNNEHTDAIVLLAQGLISRDEFSSHLKEHSQEIVLSRISPLEAMLERRKDVETSAPPPKPSRGRSIADDDEHGGGS